MIGARSHGMPLSKLLRRLTGTREPEAEAPGNRALIESPSVSGVMPGIGAQEAVEAAEGDLSQSEPPAE